MLICGTDTTIYLESLITGIPTILLFQNNNLDEIKKSELKNYKILEEHGLLYFDAQKAAKKINEIVLNPNDWWQQDKIQYAIQNFKDNYVRQSNNLSNDFLRLIKNYFVKV